VQRPRLLDLVERGVDGPLTLISAPAGYGKTVLLREWMASADEPETIAHVQLAREHAERRTFWLDVLAAIARARPELSGLAVPRRGSRSLAAIRAALGELPEPLRLVLDDLHLVGASEALVDLEWLIEHVPSGLRLVVATRRDPPIRLQRLRLAGQLTEVRADDLAFTPSEAAEFFAPLSLPPDDIERLWRRAEGWAAAPTRASSSRASRVTIAR
jgi:LuxR family transcriptional regulator, maltose regulon positive regulatory protein